MNKATREHTNKAIVYMRLNKGPHHVTAIANMLDVNQSDLNKKLYAESVKKSGSNIQRHGGGWFSFSA